MIFSLHPKTKNLVKNLVKEKSSPIDTVVLQKSLPIMYVQKKIFLFTTKNSCNKYYPLLPLFLPVTLVSLTLMTLPFPETALVFTHMRILMVIRDVIVMNWASWIAPVTDITQMLMLPGDGTVIWMLIIMDILCICSPTTITRLVLMSRYISAFLMPKGMTAYLP